MSSMDAECGQERRDTGVPDGSHMAGVWHITVLHSTPTKMCILCLTKARLGRRASRTLTSNTLF